MAKRLLCDLYVQVVVESCRSGQDYTISKQPARLISYQVVRRCRLSEAKRRDVLPPVFTDFVPEPPANKHIASRLGLP